MSQSNTRINAVYLHVPFCRRVCHYCDFAKTANYDQTLTDSYFLAMIKQLQGWLRLLGGQCKFHSVFFGGGTPGLFAKEYEPVFQVLRPFMAEDCEVSLEANPDDLIDERLAIWRDLGFNRLSVGIQSFQPQGLAFLTRDHDALTASKGLERAGRYFDNCNIDLIYGWPKQTRDQWQDDLQRGLATGVNHISLYNLTFEPQTVIGRKQLRGRISSPVDEHLEIFYRDACKILGDNGMAHEEISNWSRPGFSCRHNWSYWQNDFYIGVGSGAHGYLPVGEWGARYAYPKEPRQLMRFDGLDFSSIENILPVLTNDIGERDAETWLTETVATGLRTARGLSIEDLCHATGFLFLPRAILQEGIDKGLVHFDGACLRLSEQEWFREQSWATETLLSFSAPTKV